MLSYKSPYDKKIKKAIKPTIPRVGKKEKIIKPAAKNVSKDPYTNNFARNVIINSPLLFI